MGKAASRGAHQDAKPCGSTACPRLIEAKETEISPTTTAAFLEGAPWRAGLSLYATRLSPEFARWDDAR
jgi:hypothetical protein